MVRLPQLWLTGDQKRISHSSLPLPPSRLCLPLPPRVMDGFVLASPPREHVTRHLVCLGKQGNYPKIANLPFLLSLLGGCWERISYWLVLGEVMSYWWMQGWRGRSLFTSLAWTQYTTLTVLPWQPKQHNNKDCVKKEKQKQKNKKRLVGAAEAGAMDITGGVTSTV